jgi:hypothetical protein
MIQRLKRATGRRIASRVDSARRAESDVGGDADGVGAGRERVDREEREHRRVSHHKVLLRV